MHQQMRVERSLLLRRISRMETKQPSQIRKSKSLSSQYSTQAQKNANMTLLPKKLPQGRTNRRLQQTQQKSQMMALQSHKSFTRF